jgi:hypothetical protein
MASRALTTLHTTHHQVLTDFWDLFCKKKKPDFEFTHLLWLAICPLHVRRQQILDFLFTTLPEGKQIQLD